MRSGLQIVDQTGALSSRGVWMTSFAFWGNYWGCALQQETQSYYWARWLKNCRVDFIVSVFVSCSKLSANSWACLLLTRHQASISTKCPLTDVCAQQLMCLTRGRKLTNITRHARARPVPAWFACYLNSWAPPALLHLTLRANLLWQRGTQVNIISF